MLTSLLIANRGEIACRIIRTARALDIRTIAVHSDADTHARHVRMADEAVPIGPAPAAESYLAAEKVIAAAKATGAQAIHPGYGFLSENAAFAQAVIDAGLVWVGPPPAAIRAMGLKDAAKALMQAAGVPVTPGYLGADQSPDRLQAEADAIGYPVLIKAVAGGGGKGMRRVDAAADFADALASCRREAAAAFGDDRVLIEKYILAPRHIEVQVFGDTHGTIVHLFERDCSLQRRHQKVIEEAPAPGMDPATRAAICAAAVRAAQAVDYVGAGTVEFIADASGPLSAERIWFMEMNTRLQVEHPVTEEITGVDLVAWQLRIASGEPLPLRQEDLAITGHAIEARLYAEEPARGFLPSTGRLDHLALPAGVRVETGVEQGDSISPYYDPMIAKLIAHAPTRAAAIARLAAACGAVACHPVRTNAWFLRRLLLDPAFAAGAVSTNHIADHLDTLTAGPRPGAALLGRAAAALADRLVHGAARAMAQALRGFRLNAPPDSRIRLAVDGDVVEASFTPAQDASAPDAAVSPFPTPPGEQSGAAACSPPAPDASASISAQEGTPPHGPAHPMPSPFVAEDDALIAFEHGAAFRIALPRDDGAGIGQIGDGAILAPMPGRVIAVEVAQGERVTKGQRLLTLEAMKMEHSLTAPFDGTVSALHTVPGAQVQVGAVLARIEPAEPI
ncbi:MAG TPA: biotin carboxylase N-terminal domain-containing protein [Sphingobium sp.]|nr:biotin carboxylase N-terminal domain-containing protein [Sphingobium sp.]